MEDRPIPVVKEVEGYPWKLPVCQCSIPSISVWNYQLIGNCIPTLLPGVSFQCKCGGYIDRKIDIPKSILERVENTQWETL